MWLDYSYHIPLELTETKGAHRFSLAYEFWAALSADLPGQPWLFLARTKPRA